MKMKSNFNKYVLLLLLVLLTGCRGDNNDSTGNDNNMKKREKNEARQMEYISLINSLLQQTNVLSSVDGVLLAATTVLASLVNRMKPFLIASTLSYLLYVGTAIVLPGPLARMGLPTLAVSEPKLMARSLDGGESNSMFDNVMTDTLVKSIQISPVKSIMTNVSVNVIGDAMARVRILSRTLVQQLSLLQGNMLWLSRSLSNDCVAKFLCRVGQFTEMNFPMASSVLRSLSDSFPNMDEYAAAVIRGTSSSNCSLLYPDCPM